MIILVLIDNEQANKTFRSISAEHSIVTIQPRLRRIGTNEVANLSFFSQYFQIFKNVSTTIERFSTVEFSEY